MKNLIRGAVLLIIAVTFAACQQAADPVSPVSVDKSLQVSDAEGTGTFEITVPDARASDPSGTISGSIYFVFDEAAGSYKYKGTILTRSASTNSGTFENTGTFVQKGDIINLVDNPVIETISGTHTLELNGDFQYTVSGSRTVIEGDSRIGHIKIVLY